MKSMRREKKIMREGNNECQNAAPWRRILRVEGC